MADERLARFARMLLTYSLKLQRGELFQINGGVGAKPLIKALIKEAKPIGAVPFLKLGDDELSRLFYEFIDLDAPEPAKAVSEKYMAWERAYWEHVCAHIDIGVDENDMELAAVPPEKLRLWRNSIRPLRDLIIQERRWVYLSWPTMAQAQRAGMCYDDFFEFFLDVCLVDYEKMSRDLQPLKELMEKTDRVEIIGPGTELSFSIRGIPAVPCAGEMNIPDGEIYTAPVRESVNGTLRYNTTSFYLGRAYVNPRFVFRDGQIIEAACDNDTQGLNTLLDTDEGARYIGEFALGVNNRIHRVFGNTLYDEKIGGSFHFTPGAAYQDAFNGNKSSVHWDVVCIQTAAMGGGEIRFDGVPIRRDGLFLLPQLAGLNP